jgi:hypothetical protein
MQNARRERRAFARLLWSSSHTCMLRVILDLEMSWNKLIEAGLKYTFTY